MLLLLFVSSCSNINNKINPLPAKDIATIDYWAKKNVVDCHFLYEKKQVVNEVTADIVNKCLDSFVSSAHEYLRLHYDKPNKLSKLFKEKLYDQFIDYYLYEKLFIYVNNFSLPELTKLLKHLTNSMYAANPKYLKLLISKGVSTREVVYIINNKFEKETCKAQMLIVKNNIHLYRNEKYLNERQPKGSKPKDLIIYELGNIPSNSHCRDVVELLIKTNPNLKNSRTELGDTPLHIFMESFGDRYSKPISLAKKLITSKNINAKNNYGKTPLHVLLGFLRYYCPYHNPTEWGNSKCMTVESNPYLYSRKMLEMTAVLIKSGANVNIKDKKGITPRELMMKYPKIRNLLN